MCATRKEALEDARNPYTAVQIAKAESDVANARLDLQEAEEELSELGVVSPDLLVQARIDILNAQTDLESANVEQSHAGCADVPGQIVKRPVGLLLPRAPRYRTLRTTSTLSLTRPTPT